MDTTAHAAARRHDSPLHAIGTPTGEAAGTLPVTAVYRLSETGRKASLLSGGNGRAEQRVKVPVPPTRLHLVHVDANGVAILKLRPQFKLSPDQRIVKIKFAPVYDHPPALEELFQDAARNHELERTYHAQRTTTQTTKRETHEAWRSQVALAFLGDPSQRAVVYPAPTPRQCQIVTERGAVHFDARLDVGVARRIPLEAFRRFDADVRIRHGQGADRRARDLAVHAEKQQMLRDWITADGSTDQRERFAAGVFPFGEYVDALTDATFRPLARLVSYRKDGATRLQDHLRQLPAYADAIVAPSDLTVSTRRLSTATPTQWALRHEIHAAIGDATVRLRERTLAWTRDRQAPTLTLVTVLVIMKVGPAVVRREFHVPDAPPDVPVRTEENELMQT